MAATNDTPSAAELHTQNGVKGPLVIDIDDSEAETSKTSEIHATRHAMPERHLKAILYGFRVGIPVVILLVIVYLGRLLSSDTIWITDENSSAEEILAREASRGQVVSIIGALLLTIAGMFMFQIGVKERLVVTNFGFILCPVIGFILDQSIGSDDGWKHRGTWAGIEYSLECLIGGNFMRYIVTLFLDMFISNPLQDVLKRQAKQLGIIEVLKNGDGKHPRWAQYDHLVALNFPSLLQSIVGIVTYNAYTNQTRFAWAYPDDSLDRELRIPPGTIMLATASSAVMYLVFYTLMDTLSDRGYYAVNTKLGFVMFILILLYGLNETDSIEAPVEGEEDSGLTAAFEGQKAFLGLLMLTGFILYGFVYPVWTRLGCLCCGQCGERCTPSKKDMEETDHIIDEPNEMQISDALASAFVRKLTTLQGEDKMMLNRIITPQSPLLRNIRE